MFGRIVDIEVRAFEPPPGVADLGELFKPLRHRPYAMLLLSGGDLDCAGYSIMGWDPFLVLRAKGRRLELIRDGAVTGWEADPFQMMADLMGALELPGPPPVFPFGGGALGFLAYDLKNHLERLPTTAVDDLGLPDAVLALPRRLMVHDRRNGKFWSIRVLYQSPGGVVAASEEGLPGPEDFRSDYRVGELSSNFTREGYIESVRRIRDYIRLGDVYQVNLSQRFSFPFSGDSYELFRRLFALNPAPFYAFLNCGDFEILSTSMERFLYRQGEYLETRPIKGTRPRDPDPEKDAALRRELLASPKDDAELSMIVDLLRNDLGKVCRARTVQVQEHKRLEAYQNVYHLVSIVTGLLSPEISQVDILKATFPGGSITGCPKIRAMEIIDELEPNGRHVYTGAIGYLGCHQNLDLNVAIRTAIISKGMGYFSVGGGVVYDSDPEDEYEETLHKGRTLFGVIEREVGGKG